MGAEDIVSQDRTMAVGRHLFIETPEHLAVPFTISYHRYKAGQDTKSSQFESTDRTNRFWRFRDQQKNQERQLESERRAANARRVEEAERQWRAELEREGRAREEAEREREREQRRARRDGELEAARLARLEQERERRIATDNILRQLRQEQKRRHQLQLEFIKEYERDSRTSLDEDRQKNRRAHSRFKSTQRNSHKRWKFWDREKREKFEDKNDEIAAIDSVIKRLRREHKRLLREEIEYEKKYERATKKTIAAHARAEAKSRGVGKSKITLLSKRKPCKPVKKEKGRQDDEEASYDDKEEKEAEKKIKARDKARRKHEERKAKSEQKRKARSEGKQKEKERELMILERKRSREEAQRRAVEKKLSDREEELRVIQEMRERRQLLKEKIEAEKLIKKEEAEKYRRRYQKPRPERKVAIREYRTTTISERIGNSFYKCCCKLYCASILALVGLFFIIVV